MHGGKEVLPGIGYRAMPFAVMGMGGGPEKLKLEAESLPSRSSKMGLGSLLYVRESRQHITKIHSRGN